MQMLVALAHGVGVRSCFENSIHTDILLYDKQFKIKPVIQHLGLATALLQWTCDNTMYGSRQLHPPKVIEPERNKSVQDL